MFTAVLWFALVVVPNSGKPVIRNDPSKTATSIYSTLHPHSGKPVIRN